MKDQRTKTTPLKVGSQITGAELKNYSHVRVNDVITQSDFLFQDDLLFNLVKPMPTRDKINFLTNLRDTIDSKNFILQGKIDWQIANLSYKESLHQ